jgi:Heterokaryon incompatibility protein (HET)
MLRHWLNDCISNHDQCGRSISGEAFDDSGDGEALPSRLIDVGSLECAALPRLVETRSLRGRYFTLSHRWGDSLEYRTTKETLKEYKGMLPLDLMPQSFRDAMEVTRQLGFQYLWIDSICIIQDDEDDWRRESQQMGQIFERSCCTISAVDALDSDSNKDIGLFLPRTEDPLTVRMSCAYTKVPTEHLYRNNKSLSSKQFVWKYKWLKSPLGKGVVHNEINQSDVILRPRLPSLLYNIQRSKWYRRGWVLQERILSRRMIYYTKEKLYWDCLESSEDEEGAGSHGGSWRSGLRREGSACQVMGFWWDLVYEYSQCMLTYRHDKLVAIAGLCSQVENRLNQKCYAGIFADNAGLNLLWLPKTACLMRHLDFHAPSWSWAAYEGVITFNSNDPWEGKSENLISSINFETRNRCPASEPHIHSGRCISGTVSFTAPLGKLFRG